MKRRDVIVGSLASVVASTIPSILEAKALFDWDIVKKDFDITWRFIKSIYKNPEDNNKAVRYLHFYIKAYVKNFDPKEVYYIRFVDGGVAFYINSIFGGKYIHWDKKYFWHPEKLDYEMANKTR